MSDETTPVLIYDGTCGFCTRSVRFILARDRRGTLRFAARDSAFGRQVRQRHAALATVESLLWVEFVDGEERVRWYSDAVLASARYLGGVYGVLGWIGALVPRVVRDPGYRLIAAVRQRLVKGGACALPSPHELARMLP